MLAAVTMVKDEEDIIGYTVRHLLSEGVDLVIVADNLSSDATGKILADLHHTWDTRVRIVPDPEPGYYQSEKMSHLAVMALEAGADWVIPFDADEWWFVPEGTYTLRQFFAAVPPQVGSVGCLGFDHLVQAGDEPNGSPFARHPWRRRHPQKLPKIAFRPNPEAIIHFGNHDVSHVEGDRVLGLQLRHLQYRSLEQMTRKLRDGKVAYDLTDIPALHGTHWREGGLLTDEEMAAKWQALLDEPGLVHDPVPGARKGIIIPAIGR